MLIQVIFLQQNSYCNFFNRLSFLFKLGEFLSVWMWTFGSVESRCLSLTLTRLLGLLCTLSNSSCSWLHLCPCYQKCWSWGGPCRLSLSATHYTATSPQPYLPCSSVWFVKYAVRLGSSGIWGCSHPLKEISTERNLHLWNVENVLENFIF